MWEHSCPVVVVGDFEKLMNDIREAVERHERRGYQLVSTETVSFIESGNKVDRLFLFFKHLKETKPEIIPTND